ncbi:hypothetical protein FA15DRAFT_681535 [Coprinopsis marcescibilis]|uniref:Uncharacterized protein n=1 Tax=Coprinopsis marcescibilis TaxID=230819 RepID=A0A5C3KSC7_COPMA|nr:hypothetical protein FA15DRAFT_681535 [Coprinopsis marcescibilis]
MVVMSSEAHHDEVNLHRLLRRLEKSVQIPGEWEAGGDNSKSQVRLRAQKDLQKVKYARKLVQHVESRTGGYDTALVPQSPLDYGIGHDMNMGFVGGYHVQARSRPVVDEKVQEMNELKIRLDRVETFLKGQVQKHTEPLQRPPSILAKFPKPSPSPSIGDNSTPRTEEFNLVVDDDKSPTGTKRPSPILESADNLLLSPPELEDIVSASLVSAGHFEPRSDSPPPTSYQPTFFRPQSGASTSTATAVHASSHSATSRKPFGARAQGQIGHSSLHEELSNQLEVMASQLKRNAIFFSENLAKDKAVVEDASQKLEQNHGVMHKEKGRLVALNKLTGSTTWMTLGIVLVVLLLFVVMIGVIRFSRK